MTGINVYNVSKTLQDIFTLDKITLEAASHESVVILGPSGCGKSTLLNIISGLITPNQGRIEIGGEDWTGRTGRISYMQQKDLLLPHKTILDNLCIPLLLKGMPKIEAHEYACQYLNDFGLEGFESHYPRQLSGGMRQRAALLRTFLFTSDIIMLDEPFAGLDAITRGKMQVWLKDLCQVYQPTVLFVTHDIDEALLLADTIYVFTARPARVQRRIELSKSNRSDIYKHDIKKEIMSLLEAQ